MGSSMLELMCIIILLLLLLLIRGLQVVVIMVVVVVGVGRVRSEGAAGKRKAWQHKVAALRRRTRQRRVRGAMVFNMWRCCMYVCVY